MCRLSVAPDAPDERASLGLVEIGVLHDREATGSRIGGSEQDLHDVVLAQTHVGGMLRKAQPPQPAAEGIGVLTV